MMSPVIAVPVILLMSSIVSTDAYIVISKIPNELNKHSSQVDAKNTSNGDKFNNTQIEALPNDIETIGADSMVGVNIARTDLILDDDRPKWNQVPNSQANTKNAVAYEDTVSDARIEALPNDLEKFGEGTKIGVEARKNLNLDDDKPNWNQRTNSQVNAINTAANKERSDARIEAVANDFQVFGEGSKIGVVMPRKDSNLDDDRPKWNHLMNSQANAKTKAANKEFSKAQTEAEDLNTFGEYGAKFDTYIAKNSNLSDDKEIEIPNGTKRVKRDFEYVWDNCPGKTSLQFDNDVLKCLPDNDQGGLGDRVFEPLQNGNCATGQRRVQLGRATVCIEDQRRRKNG